MSKMEAYRLHGLGLENLQLDEIERPELKPGHAIVRVHAVSLNYRDLAVINGVLPVTAEWPAIIGSDFSGEVVEVEGNDDGFSIGDNVTAHYVQAWIDGPLRAEYRLTNLGLPGPGTFADYVRLPISGLMKTPSNWTHDEIAAIPIAGVTAWNALLGEGGGLADKTVLLYGTGGVSLFALMICAAFGAKTILLTSTKEREALAASLGASTTINYKENPKWEEAVLDAAGGIGPELIVDPIGGDYISRSLSVLATGGAISACGFLNGMQATLVLPQLFMKAATIRGIRVGSKAHHKELLDFFSTQGKKPPIFRTFEKSEMADALGCMQEARHTGKIIVRMI